MRKIDRAKMGERLRHLREEKGLTQAGLAALCGLDRKTVNRWEQGARLPDAGSFAVLMVVLQVNFRYLIGVHDQRYLITADSMDAEMWHLWYKLDRNGRESIKEMARWVLKATASKADVS